MNIGLMGWLIFTYQNELRRKYDDSKIATRIEALPPHEKY